MEIEKQPIRNVGESTCLIIADSLPLPGCTGTGVIFQQHIALTAKIFKSVSVIANFDKSRGVRKHQLAPNLTLYEGVKMLRMPVRLRQIAALLTYIYRGLRVMRQQRSDIVVAHGIRWAGFIGAVIALLGRRPYYLVIHSASPENERALYLRFITWFSIRKSTKVLFVSEGQQQNYSDAFRIRQPVILGNPVDTQIFRPPAKLLPPPKIARILFAARPTRAKGFDTFLQLTDRIIGERDDINFLILTDLALLSPADAKQIERFGERVEIRQFVDHDEFAEILNEITILVCLSLFESFSYVIAEAMACGKPVLATRCDGPIELVDPKSGVLIPIGDFSAAHEKLCWMVDHQDHFDPMDVRASITSRYAFDQIVDRMRKIFE